MTDPVVTGDVTAPPEPLMRGTFALYATPDGGRVIAFRADGAEDTGHIPIPGVMMKLWERQQRGEKIGMMDAMKAMVGNKNIVGE